ncbi:unnamed protein product [Effrenium voratum]|nr:unnamed protein product [Effrenium voratum]
METLLGHSDESGAMFGNLQEPEKVPLGLFEAATWIGEVLARSEEKDNELSMLGWSVTSVTQSIRTFSDNLPEEDRQYVFTSNQVFPQLAIVLKSAKQVLEKYQAPMLEDQKIVQEKQSNGFRALFSNSMKQGSRTLQEGLEAISSKIGRASGILRLPEDELGNIRQANSDISRLLPQLQLAISALSIRGSKRQAETMLERPQVQRCRTVQLGDGDAAGTGNSGTSPEPLAAPQSSEEVNKRPLLELKLVSEAHFASDTELPCLTTRDLRPVTAASTASLESEEKSESSAAQVRLVLGRQELRDKVTLNVPKPGGAGSLPISRFVSRDHLQIDVPEAQAHLPTQDSIQMATLAWGNFDDSQETTELCTQLEKVPSDASGKTEDLT